MSLQRPASGDAHDALRSVVLLIDDHEDTRQMYMVALDACGYCALQARDGATALALASESMPALVVTDVRMPGDVTALTVCQFFRAMAVPVIVLTGIAHQDDEVDKIVGAGCGRVLIKPVPPDTLCAEVRHALTTPPLAG